MRNSVICGRKFCNSCGRWRQSVDFACRKRNENDEATRLASVCRACVRINDKAKKTDYQYRLAVAEYNRKWQEVRRRRQGTLTREEWERLNGRQIVCGRTHCSRCKCWRPVSDFPLQKMKKGKDYRLASACYACMRVDYRKRRADPVRAEARREYDRIYKEAQRRRAGVPVRHWGPKSHRGQTPEHGMRVPVGPLQEWLDAVIAREAPDLGRGSGRSGLSGHRDGVDLDGLAYSLGVAPRALWRIRSGESSMISLSIADRLLHNYSRPIRVNGFGPVEFLWDLFPDLDERMEKAA